jgi:hypothetical protein
MKQMGNHILEYTTWQFSSILNKPHFRDRLVLARRFRYLTASTDNN